MERPAISHSGPLYTRGDYVSPAPLQSLTAPRQLTTDAAPTILCNHWQFQTILPGVTPRPRCLQSHLGRRSL